MKKELPHRGFGSKSSSTQTISVLIENDDRVFRMERGSVVKYAISGGDAGRIDVGSKVELLISSHTSKARLISLVGANQI